MASTNPNRLLLWDQAEDELERVERVLQIINPRGCTADYIRGHVDREFYRGLASYVGTGGWYVTIYKTSEEPRDGCEIWRPLVTLMAYTVDKYLAAMQRSQEVEARS